MSNGQPRNFSNLCTRGLPSTECPLLFGSQLLLKQQTLPVHVSIQTQPRSAGAGAAAVDLELVYNVRHATTASEYSAFDIFESIGRTEVTTYYVFTCFATTRALPVAVTP